MEKTYKWDRVAADYQKVCAQGGNDYNDKLIAFLLNEGMLYPGCRVLDLGCGVGKYGRVFASLGCDVTLADISPKMLEYAEKNMAEFTTPWRTLLCDFDEISAEEAMPKRPVRAFDIDHESCRTQCRDCEKVCRHNRRPVLYRSLFAVERAGQGRAV